MLLDFNSEIYSWIRGALVILFIYHLMIFLQNRKKVFLYYSLYLICFFIYFLKDISTPDYLYIYQFFASIFRICRICSFWQRTVKNWETCSWMGWAFEAGDNCLFNIICSICFYSIFIRIQLSRKVMDYANANLYSFFFADLHSLN